MANFLLYTNTYKDAQLSVTNRVKEYLVSRGAKVACQTHMGEPIERDFTPDLVLVLGGDGTILQAVRDPYVPSVPLVGINLGTLGYLSEVELPSLEPALDRLLLGDYSVEERMMLDGRVLRGGVCIDSGWALNDIVVNRCGSLQILHLKISVNGKFLHDYPADGMILTTPTGSTGYNLSAGGPLATPSAKLIVMTPICPHTLNQCSIVLAAEDRIAIEIPEGRDGQSQSLEVNFDGNKRLALMSGDRIEICKSEQVTRFACLNQVSFLEVLHRKMKEN